MKRNIIIIFLIGVLFTIPFVPRKQVISIDKKEYLAGIDDVTDANLKSCIQADNEYSSGLTSITELKCVNKGIKSTAGINNLTGLKKLELQENAFTSINVSSLTHLEYLALSNTNITSLDVSHNTALKNLYLGSVHGLTSLDVSNNTNLEAIDVALTGINQVQGLTSTKVSHLKVSEEKLGNYNINNLSHLTRVGTVDYKLIPIYGKAVTKNYLLSIVPNNITLNTYGLYNFPGTTDQSNDFSTGSYTGDYGGYYRVQVYADDDKGNVTNSRITKSGLTVGFNGYYEFRFMKLESTEFSIDHTNKTITVGDKDDTYIKNHVSLSWDGATFSITNNTLTAYYNDQKVADFTLIRSGEIDGDEEEYYDDSPGGGGNTPSNPGTSVEPIPNTASFKSSIINILGLILLVSGTSIIGYYIVKKEILNN